MSLTKGSAELLQLIAQKQVAPISLVAVLGLAGISWLATSVVTTQTAQAYTARVDVSLSRERGESFQSFLRRAEAVARAAAQRSFDRDILVTDVAVTVVGQNDGAIVPIFSLEVSRQAWRSRPDPQRWITYFPNTELLLGIEDTGEQLGTQPGGFPQPVPSPQPATPTPQSPTEPRVIELPGGNRRVIPGTPATPTAPGTPANPTAPGTPATPTAPGTPATPTAPGTPATPTAPAGTPGASPNNQVPNIPGTPLPPPPLPGS
ncbi:MAG: hypothetical protein AB1861_19765 [Cyanobacteriota bacterium]